MPEATTQARREIVDWALAERVACKIGGRSPVDPVVRADLEGVTRRAQALVTEFTGLYPTDDRVAARTLVLDRASWAQANVAAFRQLLTPITDRFAAKMAASSLGPLQSRAAGVETGFLLAYMSRRVLGQYDLLVPADSSPGAEGSSSDAVYYIAPNIIALEQRFQLRPGEFRLWIALHELTHWIQFRAVPWMRPHFLSLVERALSIVDPDPKRLSEALKRAVSEMRQKRNPFEGGGLLAALA
ncbi:MAG: zinc-dependent metalloprotease, partial [Acidimicrobiia bacterium]